MAAWSARLWNSFWRRVSRWRRSVGVGRHEATVSYWLKKYGLEAVNRGKHEAKGGLTREQLRPLVDAGFRPRTSQSWLVSARRPAATGCGSMD
jgi:hypothetical protein